MQTKFFSEIETAILLRKAKFELKRNNHDETIKILARLFKLDETNPKAHFLLGIAYDQKGEHQRSIEEYSKTIAYSPDSTPAYFNRSLEYLYIDLPDEAIGDLNRVLEIDPKSIITLTQKCLILCSENKYELALKDINRVIELGDQIEGYKIRSFIYEEIGNYQESIVDLTILINMEPRNSMAYCKRGILFEKIGENQNAKEDLEKGLKLKKGSSKELLEQAMAAKNRIELKG